MVILYIHSICWRIKSTFYERQQRPTWIGVAARLLRCSAARQDPTAVRGSMRRQGPMGWLDMVPGPSWCGTARPWRAWRGWALAGAARFSPSGAARPACGVGMQRACIMRALLIIIWLWIKFYQNFVNISSKTTIIIIIRIKNYFQILKSLFKTQKYHYIQNFQNRYILAIIKQGYNCLFHWDLTPLSPSNGIGDAACFVLKKQVWSCKVEKRGHILTLASKIGPLVQLLQRKTRESCFFLC
jgi:hypothetical protein